MAQKVSGAAKRSWKPNDGGWTPKGRQSENILDLRFPSEQLNYRRFHEFFEKAGSDKQEYNPIMFRGKPLSEIRGPHEGWDPLGGERQDDISSFIPDGHGTYRYLPNTAKKMISYYGEDEPGKFVPVSEIEGLNPDFGLAPYAETQYGDFGTVDPEMGSMDSYSPWDKRALRQATRSPGFAETLRRKTLSKITQNPMQDLKNRRASTNEMLREKGKKPLPADWPLPPRILGAPDMSTYGIAPVYGATPVTGMGGGLPYKDTLDRSMLNYEQSLLLKKALAGMRKK